VEGPVRVLAAGKAAAEMAVAASRLLGSNVRAGLTIAPAPSDLPEPFEAVAGSHPLPTARSEAAGRRALAFATAAARDESLLVLLSGGASALMSVPAAGLTVDDKRIATERLMQAGADIHAINTVRKHLSGIKGGWLAAAAPCDCRTLAISDVVGDDLSAIGSGPTVADDSTYGEALAILARYGGVPAYPAEVVTRLTHGARGELPETLKPGDRRLTRTKSSVIGGRRDAMDGAVRKAEAIGYHALRIDDPVVGEARIAAASHLRVALERAAGVRRPVCIVSSGETTVRVTGGGKGGRNQEFALAAAEPLAELDGAALVASIGTDGIDGPTDAAGAVVDSTTYARALSAGLLPGAFLDNHDAYAFFKATGDLIQTGPTGTNVGDLQIILLA
jgi:glycerate 2-kinase